MSSKLRRLLCEIFFILIILSDILVFRVYGLALVGFSYFVIDYVRHRRESILNCRHSKSLKEEMTLMDVYSIERKYSLREDYNSFEKHAAVRPPLERFFYYEKYERLRELLHIYGRKEGLWLDFGCGFGEDSWYIAQNLSQRVIGLDLDDVKLAVAMKKSRSMGENAAKPVFVAGDMHCPPFKCNIFSTILMTEALEHLIDPNTGAQNCYHLLEEGGIAVISVPSLHNIDYSLNPFRLLEKTLSLVDDRVLPPYHNLHATREYNWRNPESEYGIHFNFSRQQLQKVFEKNGFRILWQGSFEIEIMPYLLIEYIGGENVDWIRQTVRPIEKLLQRVPFINMFGQHLLIVVQKRFS